MQIDNYAQAQALTKKLEASLPMKVRPGKPLLKMMQDQGKAISADQILTIESIFYAGDEGGITCAIAPEEEDKQVYAVSLTHLRIDPEHPLAKEVMTYQRQRTRKLMLQDRGGFAAELAARGSDKKRKRRWGFGK